MKYYVKIPNKEVGMLLKAVTAGPIIPCSLSSNEGYAKLLLAAFPSFTTTKKPPIEEGESINCVYVEYPFNLRHKEDYRDRWIRHDLHIGGVFVIEYNKLNQFLGMTWDGFNVYFSK